MNNIFSVVNCGRVIEAAPEKVARLNYADVKTQKNVSLFCIIISGT